MNIVITSGGTSEKIDRVRKITNSSSGKLGQIIAKTLLSQKELNIDTLFYVCSKHSKKPNKKSNVKIIISDDTASVLKTTQDILRNNKIDVFIHTMAISDYTVDYVTSSEKLASYIKEHINTNEKVENLINNNSNVFSTDEKISSNEKDLIIKLKPTIKIISQIKLLSPKTLLIGFKLLDNAPEGELEEVAYKLLQKNHCDLVVANNLSKITATKHPATLLFKNSDTKIYVKTKQEIASSIASVLISKCEEEKIKKSY